MSVLIKIQSVTRSGGTDNALQFCGVSLGSKTNWAINATEIMKGCLCDHTYTLKHVCSLVL